MSLRIRYVYSTGATLGYSIERLVDGLLYDPSDGTFKASPASPVVALTAGTGNYAGLYKATLSSTPIGQFSDGAYAVYIHNTAASNAVLGGLDVVMHGGDDAPVLATLAEITAALLITPANKLATGAGGTVTLAVTPPTAVQVRQEIDTNSTMLAAIAGYLDTEVAAIKAKTDLLPSAWPANFAAILVTSGGLVAMDTNRTFTVRNQDGVTAPTIADAMQGGWTEAFGKQSVVGTSYGKRLPDNSAAARTFTLDSADAPTSRN